MKVHALTLIVLAAILMPIRPAAGVQQAAPSTTGLKFESEVHDFGRISDEHPVTFTFPFVNASESRTITVTDVRSSCGCTVAALEQRVFPPGERGQIEVSFNPAGRQGPERKTVTVTTDDTDHPTYELITTSNVVPRIAVEPRSIWLGEVRYDNVVGTMGPKRFQVSSRVPDFRILSAEIDDSRFTLELLQTKDVIVEGETLTRWTYEVSLEQDVPIGRIQAQVTIETSDTAKPRIPVTVLVDAVGDLRVNPERISAQPKAQGEDVLQDITVVRRDGAAFRIIGVTVVGADGKEIPDFSATSELPEPGHPGLWRLRLKGVAPAPGTIASGTVVVSTDVPHQGEVKVPFTATTRPAP